MENNAYLCWSRGLGCSGSASSVTLEVKRTNVLNWVRRIRSHKSDPGLVKLYSITEPVEFDDDGDIEDGSARLNDAVSRTGGMIGDIEGDFFSTLERFGLSIYRLASSFSLSERG